MIRRLPDWQVRLAGYLAERDAYLFHWAMNSCVTFVLGAVTAMTGQNPWRHELARLEGMRRGQAVAYMQKWGEDLPGTADRALAMVDWHAVTVPREGDIVLADFTPTPNMGTALGVCVGHRSVFVGADGLIYREPARTLTAWGPR